MGNGKEGKGEGGGGETVTLFGGLSKSSIRETR